MATKNSLPSSSQWEEKDRCPSCSSYCDIHLDLDDNDQCNDCRSTSNVREKWLMVCFGYVLDNCLASSYEEAKEIFKDKSRYEDWAESDFISEADYILDKQQAL